MKGLQMIRQMNAIDASFTAENSESVISSRMATSDLASSRASSNVTRSQASCITDRLQ